MITKTSYSVSLFRIIYSGPTETRVLFLKSLPTHQNSSSQSFQTTNLVTDGFPVENMPISKIIDVLETVSKELGDRGKVDLVEINLDTTITPVDTASDDFLSIRRQKALEKLTLSNIQALGLEKLASYNKLRYHKVDENG